MSDWQQFEMTVMEMLEEELKQLEMPIKLHRPDDQYPVYSLVMMLEGVGAKKQHNVQLEMMFLPLDEAERAATGINYMQYFAVLRDDLKPGIKAKLMLLANEINQRIPTGSFGVAEDGKLLYLRYCCPYILGMPVDAAKIMSGSVLSMIIQAVDLYVDDLIEAAGEGN